MFKCDNLVTYCWLQAEWRHDEYPKFWDVLCCKVQLSIQYEEPRDTPKFLCTINVNIKSIPYLWYSLKHEEIKKIYHKRKLDIYTHFCSYYLGHFIPFKRCGLLRRFSRTWLPNLLKAAFVGANTVKASPKRRFFYI